MKFCCSPKKFPCALLYQGYERAFLISPFLLPEYLQLIRVLIKLPYRRYKKYSVFVSLRLDSTKDIQQIQRQVFVYWHSILCKIGTGTNGILAG